MRAEEPTSNEGSVAVDGWHGVCPLDELAPGRPHIATVAGRSIGVVRTDRGEVFAVRNACPHQGAELCRGGLGGTMLPSEAKQYVPGMDGYVLRCPWHGWEFDIRTGGSLFDPDGVRVRSYPVRVEDGLVSVQMSKERKG
jgi:nitrite reductase (NADH) small subunit